MKCIEAGRRPSSKVFLLDTDHCSRLLESDPDVTAQVEANSASPMATSVITEGELLFMAQGSRETTANVKRVSELLMGIRIYQVDSATAAIYGKLKADLYDRFGPKERAKRRRTTITQLGFGDNDLWIASIALQNGLIVVSKDTDFPRIREVRNLQLASWMRVDA